MKQNGLWKLYDRLTPGERFRLDVLAMARGGQGRIGAPHEHLP
jgi:hypothetical protein